MEFLRPIPAGETKAVLFDFDGTISLLRAGWQEIMVNFMFEVLAEAAPNEDPLTLSETIEEFVTELTGKQTIYQMLRLCDEVRKRGAKPKEALSYKHGYHDRLMDAIRYRIEGLRSGRYQPKDWRVKGVATFLEELQDRGLPLYLASGTDENFVLEETRLLEVDRFFPGRIFGALDKYTQFSKELLIGQIRSDLGLQGAEFMAVGDGYVEIRDTRRANGLAVGVASREDGKPGWDEWKRERLTLAGADVLIPDFKNADPLLNFLQRPATIRPEKYKL
jgi:phosphoglycolate phosphatase-like HAD superfamily hydrolase